MPIGTLLLALTACGDEGVTSVYGPIPIDSGTAPETDGEVLPPCPTGYACTDLVAAIAATGLSGTVTDQEGNPIRYGCAAKGQETCDPADPATSCPNLPNPFCAHVDLTVTQVDQCAQKCSP